VLVHALPVADRAPQRERLVRLIEEGEIPEEGVRVARRAGKIIGAQLTLLQADGTAFVWSPVVLPGESPDVADALLRSTRDWLDESGARIGQCILDPEARKEQERFTRNGFPHLADLVFLQRTFVAPLPARGGPPTTSVPFSDQSEGDFVVVLERTYSGSLDCPGLSGRRSAKEALQGHRLAGEFSPAHWRLHRGEGTDVGLVLLNPHRELNCFELVYFGVVPEMRGKGYGRTLLRDALVRARDAGGAGVFLAVDASNTYARRLYDEFGFEETGRRAVHIRWIPDGRSG